MKRFWLSFIVVIGAVALAATVFSQSGIFLPNQLKASENLFSIYLPGHKPNKFKGHKLFKPFRACFSFSHNPDFMIKWKE